MKKLIYLVAFVALLTACTEENVVDKEYGYLSIEEPTLSCDGEIVPLSKAVSAGLQVQICQNGVVVPGHDYAPGTDLSKKIKLPAGLYTVKAFTPNQKEATNNVAGEPIYSITSSPITVSATELTTISLTVPQINVGVNVNYNTLFLEEFPSASVTVSSISGRSVTINKTDGATFRYFNIPSDGKLTYIINATNKDGEVFNETKTINVTNKRYTIKVVIK